MDDDPLVRARDRFSTGLPGRRVPVRHDLPTRHRPWGMDHARLPRPVELAPGKHEKPTENRIVTQPTKRNVDGKEVPDTETKTITD